MKSIAARWTKRYGFILLFAGFIAFSSLLPFAPGIGIGRNFRLFFLEMAAILPLMFILIGLFDVWVPREKIMRHLGPEAGAMGILWVVLLAMLQAGPLYAAFPVAALLWKKGCSVRNVFVYLGAFSTLKIPMLAFEVGFLGWKFSLLRALFSFPVFIAIAFLLAAHLQNRKFEVRDPG
ncbi:MAG TPA: permease [Candidatus Binatia bacterium]|nr:permease [Candidatus Binatia bacterium]